MSAGAAVAEYQCFIAGEWRPAAGGETFERENPANRAVLGRFPRGGPDDADRAVEAALRVHRSRVWRDLSGKDKQAHLRALADWLRTHADELAVRVSLEVGKPIRWASGEVQIAADVFDYYAGLVRDIGGRTMANLRPDLFGYTLKEPAGVAAIITPWNFPLVISAQKSAPALAAGCPVVLKPAPQTPGVGLELARAFEELELPPGLFNVVTDSGPGSPVGERLASHPDVAVVSFTGSTTTGARVMATAAKTLKRVSLECGGKSPMIVHRDANLDYAFDGALFGVFFNTGQVCNASTRLFVHEEIADEFLVRFREHAPRIRLGDPLREETQVGPIVSEQQLGRVLSYVNAGASEGAQLVVGGSRPADPALADGWFMEPTVFDGVDQSMRIAREEIFGPVLAVSRYTDLGTAIEQANATPYGLAASIWTQDLTVADAAARGLEAGTVWVNECSVMFPEAPHGGYGMSGIGREMGPEALHEFQESKTVIQQTRPAPRLRSFLRD